MTPLTITPAAAFQIQQVLASEQVPMGVYLRVGIQGGAPGCAGVSYLLGFDQPQPTDQKYEVSGIPVVIDPRHSMYVLGMEIDWHEDEHQRGFVFNNPTARAEAEGQS
jgi:iron-sulfur cluster assembly protein